MSDKIGEVRNLKRTIVKSSGMKQVKSLKELQSILNNVQAEKKAIEEKIKELETAKASLSTTISNLNESIKSYTNRQKDLIVSEHAILRYLLRVQGLDIAQVARDLVPDRIKEQIKMLGNGTYPIPEKGFKIVVKENVIVTIHAMEE